MGRYEAVIGLVFALAMAAAGCGATNLRTEETPSRTAIQTETPADTPAPTAVPVKRVRFLEAFDIGHPLKAGEGTHVFVLNSREEEALLLDGFDAVATAINADYGNETVILVTFTAPCITYEDEYSLESVELTKGAGGSIKILYTSTPDRAYADAGCPYYAIIIVPKMDVSVEDINASIENG